MQHTAHRQSWRGATTLDLHRVLGLKSYWRPRCLLPGLGRRRLGTNAASSSQFSERARRFARWRPSGGCRRLRTDAAVSPLRQPLQEGYFPRGSPHLSSYFNAHRPHVTTPSSVTESHKPRPSAGWRYELFDVLWRRKASGAGADQPPWPPPDGRRGAPVSYPTKGGAR